VIVVIRIGAKITFRFRMETEFPDPLEARRMSGLAGLGDFSDVVPEPSCWY